MNTTYDLISLIIPVYNKAEYLDRCLASVMNQDYKNIQIILIDDGSKDESGRLCDEWAKKDTRIEVLHKDNAGLGMARNSGLKLAKGQYIAFVDADDSVAEDYISQLYEAASKNNADIVYCGCSDIGPDGSISLNIAPEKTIYSTKEELQNLMCDIIALPPTLTGRVFTGKSQCMALYSKDFYLSNKLENKSEREIISEDMYFNLEALKHAQKAVIVPTSPYYYYSNEDSLTTSYRKDRFEKIIVFREALLGLLKDEIKETPELSQRIDRNYMDNLIHCLRNEILFYKEHGLDCCKKQINLIISNKITQNVLANYPLKRVPFKQRILFTAAKNKSVNLCFLLLKLRYRNFIV